MSLFEERTISCPQCGFKHDEQIATSLKPKFKEAILAGTFQRFVCENCGHSYRVDDPLMYIDFTKKLWIAQYPRDWEKDWAQYELIAKEDFDKYVTGEFASPLAHQLAPGFIIRTVFGLDALAEKIVILENKIDDRLLSVLKWQMMNEVEGLTLNPNTRPMLIAVADSELVFRVLTQGVVGSEIMALPLEDAFDGISENESSAWAGMLKDFAGRTYVDAGIWMFNGAG